MLKGIPSILSPELLKILMEMGHGEKSSSAMAISPQQAMRNASSAVMGTRCRAARRYAPAHAAGYLC